MIETGIQEKDTSVLRALGGGTKRDEDTGNFLLKKRDKDVVQEAHLLGENKFTMRPGKLWCVCFGLCRRHDKGRRHSSEEEHSRHSSHHGRGHHTHTKTESGDRRPERGRRVRQATEDEERGRVRSHGDGILGSPPREMTSRRHHGMVLVILQYTLYIQLLQYA